MKTLPTLIAVLVIGVLGTLFTLGAMGKIDAPGFKSEKKNPIPAGYKEILVSATKIPAYTKVGREHIIDPRSMNFSLSFAPADQASSALGPGQVIGRVMARDKSAGYAFTESDFAPEGTREGIAAGVPPGKRAMVIEAGMISGIHALNPGDHFDLVSMAPLDQVEAAAYLGPVVSSVTARNLSRLAQAGNLLQPIVLVKNGVIVRGVTSRQEAYLRKSGLVGAQVDVRYKPVDEVTLGVEASEVIALTQAMTRGGKIVAVARSGQNSNGTPETEIVIPTPRPTPTPVPVAAANVTAVKDVPKEKLTIVEVFNGTHRDQMVFRDTANN